MRIIALFCYLLLFIQYGNTQEENLSYTIPIAVILKDLPRDIDAQHREKLNTKIKQILTNGGMTGEGGQQEFIIYPTIDIYEINILHGYKKQIAVKVEFSLFIAQQNNQLIFASTSKMISGVGRNQKIALSKAINSLKSKDVSFKTFLEEGRQNIMEYYANNCSQIIAKATTYQNVNNYGKAINELGKVPATAACYGEIQVLLRANYLSFQEKHCQILLQKAKAAQAVGQYPLSLYYLIRIDPESNLSLIHI